MHLRVVTLNLRNNQGDPRRPEIINQELRRLNPDLVSLQEVIDAPAQNQLETLLDGLNLHSTHQSSVLAGQPPQSERYGGTALAARWPQRFLEALDPHISDGNDVPWGTLAPSISVPDARDRLFIGTTLSWCLSGGAVRKRQALALRDLACRHRTSLPTIIPGDFSASPETAGIRNMNGLQSIDGRSVKYHDPWVLTGERPGYTRTADNPNARFEMDRIVRQPNRRRRIDHVFVGSRNAHPNTHCRSVSASLAFNHPIERIWLSDHFRVVADLEFCCPRNSRAASVDACRPSLPSRGEPCSHGGNWQCGPANLGYLLSISSLGRESHNQPASNQHFWRTHV